MSFREMLLDDRYTDIATQMRGNGIEGHDHVPTEDNGFSGASYRNINIIVDYPIRVEHLMGLQGSSLLGRVVFVMVEFQVVDEETALQNEEGENAHRLYKERQLDQVKRRLRKGGR
jgi:uncharacterized protein (TIGR04552 family)